MLGSLIRGSATALRLCRHTSSSSTAAMPEKLNLATALHLCRHTSSSSTAAMPKKLNLASAFAKISEPWSPHVAGDVNEAQIKLAKFSGEFVWHHHEEEDECFLVVRGKMRMKFRGGDVDCEPGELIVVPRMVEHCPVALSEPCEVLLVERSSTLNTGSAATEIGDTVHERGSQTLTKTTLNRID